MIKKKNKLNPELFSKDIAKRSIRDGFGLGLLQAGRKNKNVVVVGADLTRSTRSDAFVSKFPDRYIEVGVAEQNLACVASGLANYGKIPFMCSFAAFSPARNFEQIRTTIALNHVPVKIVGSHAGVMTGEDGATHQALEDIALMRMLPNMAVVVPCDSIEAIKATKEIAFNKKPSYLRLCRPKTPIITTKETKFKIGKAELFVKGDDVTIVACGPLVYEALIAAKILFDQGIKAEVINNHTIKPLDEHTLVKSVKKTNCLVTVEDHQTAGGLGSALVEMLAKKYPVPTEMIGVHDQFGQSGTEAKLLNFYKLSAKHIVNSVKKVMSRK